jgi:hypothetical protein
MDQAVILWILGSINALNVVVMGAIAKALFDHVKECRETRSALAAHEERVKVMESEVEKLRTEKHTHAGFLTQHELRIGSLERDAGKL